MRSWETAASSARSATRGWVTRLASVTKPLVAYACLVAVEEGTLALDQPAGPTGSTVRHLLAHASGLPFEGREPIAAPGTRRVYSNTGFGVLAATLADAAGMDVASYVAEAVFEPLGMAASELRDGDAGAGVWSCVDDLRRFAVGAAGADPGGARVRWPRRPPSSSPGWPASSPGWGSYDPCPWGLGLELKGAKAPHWTAPQGSPRTFGHFGGAGTFLWVDPDAGVGCVVLTDREFGDWAPPAVGGALARRCSTRPAAARPERRSEAGGLEVGRAGGDGRDQAVDLRQDLVAVEPGGHDLLRQEVGVAQRRRRRGAPRPGPSGPAASRRSRRRRAAGRAWRRPARRPGRRGRCASASRWRRAARRARRRAGRR